MLDLTELYRRYKEEERIWKEAGKPMRSPKEMRRIHSICSNCPLFLKGNGWIPGYDKCSDCQCNLHPSAYFMNKIAWATTHCPANPPLWDAEAGEDAPH